MSHCLTRQFSGGEPTREWRHFQELMTVAHLLGNASIKRHLVLDGPAGTGKTLTASQVANNLLESATETEEAGKEPLLVVSTQYQNENDPIMKYLNASTGTEANKIVKSWPDMIKEFGVANSEPDMGLVNLTEALSKRWEGRQIVVLLDEILDDQMLLKLGVQRISRK